MLTFLGKHLRCRVGGVLKRPWLDPTLFFTRWGQNLEDRLQGLEVWDCRFGLWLLGSPRILVTCVCEWSSCLGERAWAQRTVHRTALRFVFCWSLLDDGTLGRAAALWLGWDVSDFMERRPGGLWRGCREPVPLNNAEDEAILNKNSPDDRQCIMWQYSGCISPYQEKPLDVLYVVGFSTKR